MPEFDYKAPNRNQPRKRRDKKQNVFAAIVTGLLPWRGDTAGDVVRKLVFLISIATLIIAALMLFHYYVVRDMEMELEIAKLSELKEKYEGEETVVMHISEADFNSPETASDSGADGEVEVLGEYLEYYERNSDFVGWVGIDPIVNYPVTQYTDNDFYLKHNFDKNPTANGTIFADYEDVITADYRSPNIIIYGHNLRTKYFFEPLVTYRKAAEFDTFVKDHLTITFDTLYERGTYKIFAAMLTPVADYLGEVFRYWDWVDFKSKAEFDGYVAECLDRSYFYTGVDVAYGDELITLSTCDFSMFTGGESLSNMRLVIVGRRVRENESPLVDPANFIDNSGQDADKRVKRKMFTEYYKTYGTEWAGRNWDRNYIKDFMG